jgi:hypothetical protein
MKSDHMGTRDPISIQGIVIAAAWTPNGDVTEVDIAGYDEKRYRVVGDHIGGQLRDHIKKRVVVDGVVKTIKGSLVITVKRFRVGNPGKPKSSVSKTVTPHL